MDLNKLLGFDAWEHFISLVCALLEWSEWFLLDLILTEHTKLVRQAGPVSKKIPL